MKKTKSKHVRDGSSREWVESGSGEGREWVGSGSRVGRERVESAVGTGRVETALPSLGASSSGGFLPFLLSNRLNHPPIPPFFGGASPSPSSWHRLLVDILEGSK